MARHWNRWVFAMVIGLLIVAVMTWHPVPFVIALFLGIVGLAERRAIPFVRRAIEAYDTGKPTSGEATITVTTWDSDDHYHAIIQEPGCPDWEYAFIPQRWHPVAGKHAARIWRSEACGAPVLAVLDEGILIPRYLPHRCGAEAGKSGRRQ